MRWRKKVKWRAGKSWILAPPHRRLQLHRNNSSVVTKLSPSSHLQGYEILVWQEDSSNTILSYERCSANATTTFCMRKPVLSHRKVGSVHVPEQRNCWLQLSSQSRLHEARRRNLERVAQNTQRGTFFELSAWPVYAVYYLDLKLIFSRRNAVRNACMYSGLIAWNWTSEHWYANSQRRCDPWWAQC